MPKPEPYASISSVWVPIFKELDPSLELIKKSTFRCVSLSRLESVVLNGVDVEPLDHQIYTTMFFDKAWEYGGWPKIAMAFDQKLINRTFKEVPFDTDKDELAEIRKTYPTMLTSADGKTLWLSRLAEDDPHIAKSYEIEYGCWIPGDPLQALSALIVFTDEEAPCLTSLMTLLEASPHWSTTENQP